MAWGVPIPLTLAQAKADLERQIAELQAVVGEFLLQKRRLLMLQSRASALSKFPQTSAASAINLAKINALLDQQNGLEKDSMKYAQEANGLYRDLTTDPLWKSLSTANLSILGWESINRIKFMLESVVNATRHTGLTFKRIQDHKEQIDAEERDLSADESFAQGKGIRATVTAATTGATGFLSGPLGIFAGVAAVMLLGPQFLKGLARGRR